MRTILGPGAKCRGYIQETSTGKQLLAPGGRLVAYYDSQKDQTILAGGNLYGYGDQLMDLLEG
jgi:hypothetical protein